MKRSRVRYTVRFCDAANRCCVVILPYWLISCFRNTRSFRWYKVLYFYTAYTSTNSSMGPCFVIILTHFAGLLEAIVSICSKVKPRFQAGALNCFSLSFLWLIYSQQSGASGNCTSETPECPLLWCTEATDRKAGSNSTFKVEYRIVFFTLVQI